MPFKLPELPYNLNALQPHISAQIMDFHYHKHHQTYVTNLNKMIENTDLENLPLEKIIHIAHGEVEKTGIFNNAAQVWNHTFYWHCMKAHGGGKPSEKLAAQIDKDFNSFDNFKAEFKQAAISQFGSGWAWLVLKDHKLSILKTGNADLPMVHGYKALLTCDVWEHAYYLDYQNRRADYVDVFLNHLINWKFVEENFNVTA